MTAGTQARLLIHTPTNRISPTGAATSANSAPTHTKRNGFITITETTVKGRVMAHKPNTACRAIGTHSSDSSSEKRGNRVRVRLAGKIWNLVTKLYGTV